MLRSTCLHATYSRNYTPIYTAFLGLLLFRLLTEAIFNQEFQVLRVIFQFIRNFWIHVIIERERNNTRTEAAPVLPRGATASPGPGLLPVKGGGSETPPRGRQGPELLLPAAVAKPNISQPQDLLPPSAESCPQQGWTGADRHRHPELRERRNLAQGHTAGEGARTCGLPAARVRPPEWDGPQRKGGRSSCCRPLGGPPVAAETILEGPISSRPPVGSDSSPCSGRWTW